MLNKPTKVPVHFFFHCLPLAQFIFFPKTMGDSQTHLGPGLCTFWACDGHLKGCYAFWCPLHIKNVHNQGPNVSRQQQDVSKLHQTHLNWTIGQGREKEMQQLLHVGSLAH
jgi:hypothetical protein